MMCLLKVADGEIAGWLMAGDTHDLRRSLDPFSPDSPALASWLYVNEFVLPGKHELPGGYLLLVQ